MTDRRQKPAIVNCCRVFKIEFMLMLLFVIVVGCNSTTLDKQHTKAILTENDQRIDSIIKSTPQIDYSDSVNFVDSNGLKQGQWVKKWKGKLIEKYTYVDHVLHGDYETEHGKGYFENGKMEGLQYTYYGDKKGIMMVTYCEKGERIWSGFPLANRDFLIPVKDFHIYRDSIEVKAPYMNGQTWYEGNFCLLPDRKNNNRYMPYRYGVHKVYHMNGKVKGIVDYSKQTVQEFDSLGNQKYQAKFEETEIHQLPTLGAY